MRTHDPEPWLEGEAIASETLQIDASAVEAARHQAQTCRHPNRQWSLYLQALAEAAFRQWLADWAPDLEAQAVPDLPFTTVAAGLGSASYQQVGPWRVALLRLDSTQATVILPQAAIALPNYCAHLYLALEVCEELQTARIDGFLRYDQVRDRLQSTALRPAADWTYDLPLNWFQPALGEGLLLLRCLAPAAIPLPPATAAAPTSAARPAALASLRAQLHAEALELWQVLDWDQFVTLLTTPGLLAWFLEPPTAVEQVLNVATWLQETLDDWAAALNWVLLPAGGHQKLAPEATGLRSPAEELDNLMVQLERQGTTIAPEARGGYQDFDLAGLPLRLYAITWVQFAPQAAPEWRLLLVLGTPDSCSLPDGITLRVSDNYQVLIEHQMRADTDAPYLYACVAGTWEETFTVEVLNPQGMTTQFPVFAFRPRRSP